MKYPDAGLPERIKVTISREDGAPLFDRDQSPESVILTEAAPILIVYRDGRTLRTACGDVPWAREFVEGLTLPF